MSAAHAAAYEAKPWLSSYVTGTPPMLSEPKYANLADLVTACSRTFSSQVAFTCCLPNGMQGHLTYAEVDALSSRFAAYLRNVLGLVKGDRVAVQTPNCLAQPIAMFAIFKAGLVLVNVNPLYTAPEMEHQFNDSGAKALVIIDLFGDKLTEVIPKTSVRHVVTVSLADFFPQPLRAIIKLKLKLEKKVPKLEVHAVPFATAMAEGARSLAGGQVSWRPGETPAGETPVSQDDIAVLQYTGGTTGVSKGAMLTHRNLLNQVQQIQCMAGGDTLKAGQETFLTALPLYHIFALAANLLFCYVLGSRNVLIPSPRPLSNLKKPFEKFNFTVVTGVNTLYAGLMNEPWFDASKTSSIKAAIAGGTALLSATAERWTKITGKVIYEGYGLTESSPVICVNPVGGRAKRDHIGIPVPSTEVRIVDDNGHCVAQGEPGEIIARGPQVMLGYWKRPEETAKCIKDGWLYTGDVAFMDPEGYFRIVDRKKDLILVSGFNVYPNEVEDAIAKHPDVAFVGVIGVPDDQTGEAVRAYVVPKSEKLTPEDVREHCKTLLTNYKVPRKVEFRKEIPMTPVGKVLRKDLRTEYLKGQEAAAGGAAGSSKRA
jgi:long-chain acyl-CoA synthetase